MLLEIQPSSTKIVVGWLLGTISAGGFGNASTFVARVHQVFNPLLAQNIRLSPIV